MLISSLKKYLLSIQLILISENQIRVIVACVIGIDVQVVTHQLIFIINVLIVVMVIKTLVMNLMDIQDFLCDTCWIGTPVSEFCKLIEFLLYRISFNKGPV